MKRGTKVGWLLIAVSIMLSVWVIISTSAVADSPDANGYVISDDGTTLTGIPDSGVIDKIPDSVTTIADDVFKDKQNISTIVIPSSVTNLGTGFQGCTGLTSISLGNGITSIPANTFYNCSSLRTIEIPASVTGVDPNAFRACYGLVGFSVANGNTAFSVSSDNCLYSADGTTLVNVPDGKTSVSIPETCKTIAAGAFNDCSVESVTIPATVTNIGAQPDWDVSEIWGTKPSAAYDFAMENNIEFRTIGNGGGEETVSYAITAGANQAWTKGSGTDVTITGSGDFSKFTGVQMDGSTVSSANYTAASGSTVVTLKSAYLETLSNGNHTFTILWNDGSASTTLSVAAGSNSGEDDNNNGNNSGNNNGNKGNATKYTITSGANATWTKGSGTTLSFTGSGPLSEFAGIKVDGTTVGASNYSATTSPTVLTLSNAYLESLSVGNHSMTVVWTGGTATANFNIAAPAGAKDSTGSTSKTTTTTTTKTTTSTSTGNSHTKDSTPATADGRIDPRYFLAMGLLLIGIAVVINGRGKQINYVKNKRNQ